MDLSPPITTPATADADRPGDLRRRTASLAIFRSDSNDRGSRSSRRLSLSLWRGRGKESGDAAEGRRRDEQRAVVDEVEKKRMWNWKPMRALSHIGMRRVSCLSSVDVNSIYGLPESMNGLRLVVAVRKEYSKSGGVQTVPSRVSAAGIADFDETLFLRCNLYCSGGRATGKPLKLEPRRFVVSVITVDAQEHDFGKNIFDLSSLVVESVEKSIDGHRLSRWDKRFRLGGKAAGGELAVRVGFQLMEDTGMEIYGRARRQDEDHGTPSPARTARSQSKSSFSIAGAAKRAARMDSDEEGFDDIPEFDVIDIGVEPCEEALDGGVMQPQNPAKMPPSSREMAKELFVDHRRGRGDVMVELDAIAKEIQALEALMSRDVKPMMEKALQPLDSDEETVTMEFVRMLEIEEDKKAKRKPMTPTRSRAMSGEKPAVLLPNLGRSLGLVIQTRDGGFLTSMNPLDVMASVNEAPKLTMQISKPFVLAIPNLASAFEVFQRLAAVREDELTSGMLSWAAMDELSGKSTEQIAYEGIASAVINGRSKGGGGAASSSATKSIQTLRKMASEMTKGRKSRASTGVWFASEDPVAAEDILAFALQRMEAMALDALKIQADMAEEDSPFEVSPIVDKTGDGAGASMCIFDALVPLQEWASRAAGDKITMLYGIQLRDPSRRLEAIGAPMLAVAQALASPGKGDDVKYKVTSLHIGGERKSKAAYDGEKQRLTAIQWLVTHGLAKPPWKKWRSPKSNADGRRTVVWSVSARLIADVWTKTMRNPDVSVGK